MAQPQPPPIANKRFSKTAIIVIAILVVACVALASTTTFLLSRMSQSNNPQNNNPQNNTTPDISGVQVLSVVPYARMSEDGFATQTPYRFHIYINLQIKNPTQYYVTLRLYGEINVTLTDIFGTLSGNYVLDNTADFTAANYSQTDYQIPIYLSSGWYSSSDAVSGKINSFSVSELWRGIGSPP